MLSDLNLPVASQIADSQFTESQIAQIRYASWFSWAVISGDKSSGSV